MPPNTHTATHILHRGKAEDPPGEAVATFPASFPLKRTTTEDNHSIESDPTSAAMPRTKSKSVTQRRKQGAKCMRRSRLEETEEATEKRLASNRERMKKLREEETPEEKRDRLAFNRERMKRRRQKKSGKNIKKLFVSNGERLKKCKVETPRELENHTSMQKV
ncbi:hypothetical protein GWK47_022262 [Chionoecetes opilio]|uniref:Uncharacterized protein n=1 Tax=Chionoecetes opilio TaxID=41210 RepID=A0A8J4XN72_CHIOP|nr:hypothetical protein GWK47_022262 [Chionoecetes opilio]